MLESLDQQSNKIKKIDDDATNNRLEEANTISP